MTSDAVFPEQHDTSTTSMDSFQQISTDEKKISFPRPSAIIIPPNHSSLTTDSTDNDFKSIGKSSSSESNDFSSDASLLFVSNLRCPSVSIPRERTKTPRTPQSVRYHRKSGTLVTERVESVRRRTRSPVDEMCLGPVNQSPSLYIANKYKSQTPKASDFLL